MRGLALSAFFFLPVSLPAQTASYAYFGKGCQKNNLEVVPFAVTGLPRPGSAITIRTWASCQLGTYPISLRYVWIFTGVSNIRYGPLRLPFDTSVLSRPSFSWCGHLRTSVEWTMFVPQGSTCNQTDITFPIPNDPGLLGSSFFQQVFVVTRKSLPSGSDFRFELSRGGQGRIGR